MYDIVITGRDNRGISELKDISLVSIPDQGFGTTKVFPWGRDHKEQKGIFLSQRKYVQDLLKETGKLGAKPCSTPLTSIVHPRKDGEPFHDPGR